MIRKNVLWVDDEIEYLRSHIMFLETRGYSVSPVFNGDDAIHLLSKESQKFDMVLLDEQMPGKSGLDTLLEIKALYPELPVVMVTKSEEERIMEEAIGRKIDGYLTKPVNPSQILQICKQILHSKEQVSSQLKFNFVRSFSTNRDAMQYKMDADEWMKLYCNFVKWDIELSRCSDESIRQAHIGQKSDANELFSEFVSAHYMKWVQDGVKAPMMSPDIMGKFIAPRIDSDEPVILFVFDSLRMDQYMLLQSRLKKQFNFNNYSYFSLLPAAPEFSGHALMSGLFPDEAAAQFATVAKEIYRGEYKKNNNIEKVLLKNLTQNPNITKENMLFKKLEKPKDITEFSKNFSEYTDGKKLVVFYADLFNMYFNDKSNATQINNITDETHFSRNLVSWFHQSAYSDLFDKIAFSNFTTVLTAPHGHTLCTRPTEIYGESNISMSSRYRHGTEITCDERYALFIDEPERYRLPKQEEESKYIVLKENYYFVNHDTYDKYNEHYQNVMQYGGVSMEELIVPLGILRPAKFDI